MSVQIYMYIDQIPLPWPSQELEMVVRTRYARDMRYECKKCGGGAGTTLQLLHALHAESTSHVKIELQLMNLPQDKRKCIG